MFPNLLTSPFFITHSFGKKRRKYIQSSAKLKFIVVLAQLLFQVTISNSQVNTYPFSTTSGNILETGGFTNLLGTTLDDDVSATTNIGFTFRYGGTDYTDFSVTSNGLLRFGGAAVTEYINNIANLSGPYLLPYWDDNYTDVDGNVQYKLMGVAGSRKLVVEYNLSHLSTPGTADKHFQIWLFETTNSIMFVYGNGNNFNDGFSTGILTSGLDFMSVTTSTNTCSIVAENNNNTTWPGTGIGYSFNSMGTLPVTLASFLGYKEGIRNQLQWTTTTETNNLGFEVQRSTDGINYSAIEFVVSKAISGNSSSILNYSFADNNVTSTRNYYRLRQVDIDNRSKLSKILLLDNDRPLILTIEGLFPNPASSIANVQISSPVKDKVTIFITDVAGKILQRKEINVDPGHTIVPLDISQLAKNIYLLKLVSTAGIQSTFKMMVN